jgi:hypothetical protein
MALWISRTRILSALLALSCLVVQFSLIEYDVLVDSGGLIYHVLWTIYRCFEIFVSIYVIPPTLIHMFYSLEYLDDLHSNSIE